MSVIQVQQLSKQFRTRVSSQQKTAWLTKLFRPQYRSIDAVKQVSFSVEEGEVVAFLGPNGAGKSTTIKMLTGILQPSGGSSTVLGFDPAKQRRQLAWQIGSVFGQRSQLWFHLPPADSFRLLGAIYELEPSVLARRTAELVERFALQDYFDVAVRKLSLGQRIRCEIAASLLHKPRLLFLDEPTIGLDVVARREIRSLLSELNSVEKVTVFITSHDMGDIAKVCKRAIIIHHGEVVVDESMKDLKHRALAKKYVGVRYQEPVQFSTGGLQPLKATDRSASFEIDTRQHSLPELVRRLSGLGELEDITIEDEPLENVIADIYAARSEQAARNVTAGGRAKDAAAKSAGSGKEAAGADNGRTTGSGESQAAGGLS
ncbi:MAG: ATP-binding cassette domain-containing protein [Spirochaetes bacterium]|nr:ATP-binding cassette domain-containing protein [Spirochaetota bacterium]MBU0956104.1 ATP-binding cassette domain-containing protein [Spirochaetota bacterium]